MKIVVLDGYTENPGDLSWDEMKKYGELTVYDRTPAEEVVNRIGNAEVVFTNKTPDHKRNPWTHARILSLSVSLQQATM